MFFTDGARELSTARPGPAIDVFFLWGGGGSRREGNINLVSIGDYDHIRRAFHRRPFAQQLYYVVPKVILFRVDTRATPWFRRLSLI